jgi:hypothetical protein
LDPDPDPGGQKGPTKIEKSIEIPCFKVLDVLRAEGFSCSLDGLGIRKLQFLIKKYQICFQL